MKVQSDNVKTQSDLFASLLSKVMLVSVCYKIACVCTCVCACVV